MDTLKKKKKQKTIQCVLRLPSPVNITKEAATLPISVKNTAHLHISRYMVELQSDENDSSKSHTDITLITFLVISLPCDSCSLWHLQSEMWGLNIWCEEEKMKKAPLRGHSTSFWGHRKSRAELSKMRLLTLVDFQLTRWSSLWRKKRRYVWWAYFVNVYKCV